MEPEKVLFKKSLEPKGIPFVNADILAKKMFPDDSEANSYEAAKYAEKSSSTTANGRHKFLL